MLSNLPTIQDEANSCTVLQAKADYLKGQINGALKQIGRKRKENRAKASVIRVATLVFSAVVTILLGLQIAGVEQQFRNLAFIFGALVTLINALEPFFNFRALWVEHERALWKLHRLKDKTEYYFEGIRPEQMDAGKLDEFELEYQDIWDELSKSWIDYRKQYQS